MLISGLSLGNIIFKMINMMIMVNHTLVMKGLLINVSISFSFSYLSYAFSAVMISLRIFIWSSFSAIFSLSRLSRYSRRPLSFKNGFPKELLPKNSIEFVSRFVNPNIPVHAFLFVFLISSGVFKLPSISMFSV